jgi:DNA-binding response OmpR family regulator
MDGLDVCAAGPNRGRDETAAPWRRHPAPVGPVLAGPVTIYRDRHEVTHEGTLQALTKTDCQILTTLAARQGEAVSREDLMLEPSTTSARNTSR